jgi:hypothetical protein
MQEQPIEKQAADAVYGSDAPVVDSIPGMVPNQVTNPDGSLAPSSVAREDAIMTGDGSAAVDTPAAATTPEPDAEQDTPAETDGPVVDAAHDDGPGEHRFRVTHERSRAGATSPHDISTTGRLSASHAFEYLTDLIHRHDIPVG